MIRAVWARHGRSLLGGACHGKAGMATYRSGGRVMASRQSGYGIACLVPAVFGWARCGVAGQLWRGQARFRMARHGTAWRGVARQASNV